MSYTPSDIHHLKKLAYHANLNNTLLAFELVKGNGWEERLSTPLYWMHQRFVREQKIILVAQIEYFLEQNAPNLLKLGVIFSWATMPINSLLQQCELLEGIVPLDYGELAEALYQLPLSNLQQQAFSPFLIRFGNNKMQEELFPLLIRRQHTGITSLDLSTYQFKEIPAAVLTLGQLQELHLDANQLTTLPDRWEAMDQLEILHLRENQLSTLPPSFAQLQALKRLYIQDNPWAIQQLTKILKALPSLEYISVGHKAEEGLCQLEALVTHGLLNASEQEQRLFLALELQDPVALEQLDLLELLRGLQHEQGTIRAFARVQLLKRHPPLLPLVKTETSIAILGLVSFAMRLQLEQLKADDWKITNEITPQTTHLLLGDHPEQYEAVAERTFVFVSEQDVLTLS
ncbi:MAG: leucine-rich repeat domain-containing protein [Aureispira sp.]